MASPSTNADRVPTTATSGDAGLNQPVKSFLQTQATDDGGLFGGVAVTPPAPDSVLGGLAPGEFSQKIAPTSVGVGSNDDDPNPLGISAQDPFGYEDPNDPATSKVGTVTGTINSNTRAPIYPQANVLDTFSSYTYRISVYLMTPTQVRQLQRSGKKSINGYNLLFQSGGAPTNVGGFQGALNTTNQAAANAAAASVAGEATEAELAAVRSRSLASNNSVDAGRNPAFPLDFYIDSVTISTLTQGKGSGTAHNNNELKFTVVEPVGITLLDRIYEAVQDAAPSDATGKVNYQTANYLMVIRFYGYDQDGNIKTGNPNNSDPRAAVEKLIPFVIKSIKFQVSNKATTYEFECAPQGQIVAGGTRRGTVPYDVQLSQGTVGKILGADNTFKSIAQSPSPAADTQAASSDKAPPKASAAATPKTTVTQGLMAAMNQFAQSLTTGSAPVYEIADQYEIVFAKGAEDIRDATIVLPGKKVEAKNTPMNQPATANSTNLNPDTQSKDNSVSTKTITAGQPIVQIIDQVIRNSSYITNQALTIYDQENDTPRDNPTKTQKPVNWYRINFDAVPIGDKQDSRRNDYAYKIRYIISKYQIDHYDSKYFPLGNFRGVHKSYPWIFTGQNTAILDYSEQINSSYQLLVSGSDPTNSAAEIERRKRFDSMRDMYVYTYGARSAETSQGSRYKGNEVAANLADSLYTSADLGQSRVRIIGDPAWIQQGYLVNDVSNDIDLTAPFLPDGTINYDASQVLFEVNWARPSDYDLNTGLADPASGGRPISRVYVARRVTSEFRGGKFEQTLEGLLFTYPKPDGSNKAPGAPMPTKTIEGRTLQEISADPRVAAKVAAGTGAGSTQSVPAPPTATPVSVQQVNTNTAPVNPNDTVRPAPPPTVPSSGTGQDLAVVNELGQASRFRRNPETGELYDSGVGPIVSNPQDQAWEP